MPSWCWSRLPITCAGAENPRPWKTLPAHDCIQFELPSSGRTIPWLFRRDGQDIELPTSGGYACSDDVLGGVTLALHGAGIFQAYRFVVEEDLRQGRLIEVLKPFGGRARPFNLLYPQLRFVPLRVRTFVDFLMSHRAIGGRRRQRPVP